MTIAPTSTNGRVNIAVTANMFTWSPTWTCVDYHPGLVSRIDINRGRQTELDTTDTSTAVVYLNDTDGLFDPANTLSPFYSATGLEGRQIKLQCWNPVTSAWVQQTRMWISEITYDFNPAGVLSNVQLQCVDMFDYLASIEMDLTSASGNRVFGNNPPANYEGVVFYEDSASTGSDPGFDDRVEQILIDAGVTPNNWYVVFTGNVDLLEGVYDPGDSPLTAIRDTLDAEFPAGMANAYTDKQGRFCVHGRGARFDPDTVAADAGAGKWNFTRWYAGDGDAIDADPDRAQIRPPLQWSRGRDRIINIAFCYPKLVEEPAGSDNFVPFAESDKPAQYASDPTSISRYGRRSWRAENLLVKEGTTTGNTGPEECLAFAEFMVANYSEPKVRIEALTLKSTAVTNPAATATWAMLVGADISDAVDLKHTYPNGSVFNEEFFIEGSEMSIVPLNGSMDLVELTVNVSPVSNYADALGLLG